MANIRKTIEQLRGSKAIIVTDLQAELASTLKRLLPTAEAQARKGKPALLRLLMRYATNRYLLASTPK